MSLKTFGASWLEVTSPSLAIAHQRVQSAATHQAETAAKEVVPFYPNPGSQSDLFFNLLGFSKGEPVKTIDYPKGQAQEIKAILDENGYTLSYPEVLAESLKTYPVDITKGYAPKYPNILYRAGSRTGKTWGGAAYVVEMTRVNPGNKGLISANTIAQLRDSTITTLLEHLIDRGVPFSPWRGSIAATANSIAYSKQMVVNGCTVICRSAADFMGGENSSQAILGLGFLWAWLDEWLRIPNREPFDVLSTRMSQKGARPIRLITSTINTDNPYNWGYELFDNDERSPEIKARFVSLTGSTIENRHRISETYVQDQHAQMIPEFFKIHVLGEYAVTTEGKILKYFNRDLHVFPADQLDIDERHPIYLSFDFNCNPASAIAGQFIEGELRIVREWGLTDSNTFESAAAVAEWLEPYSNQPIIVTGDATGGSRSANSRLTNWQIVAKELRRFDAYYVYGKSNPGVQDTINSLNTALSHDRVLVCGDCKELIKDIETATYPYADFKRKNGDRSHWLDELRYLTEYVMPYVNKTDSGLTTVANIGVIG